MAVKIIEQMKFKDNDIVVGDKTYTFPADLLKKAAIKKVTLSWRESKLTQAFISNPKDGAGKIIEFKDVIQKISKELEKAYPKYTVELNHFVDEYSMPYLSLLLKKK